MLELSTPVVELWDGILALPLIGTLDSQRTQVVMENLLESIVLPNQQIAQGFELEETWTHDDFGAPEVSETWRLKL